MFGISMYELGLIALIGLIFLGPRQLTETAKVVGKMVRELQRMASDVQKSIDFDLDSPTTTSSSSSYNYNNDAGRFAATPPPAHDPDKDLKINEGEKLGPDFYAELLASSAEPEPLATKDPVEPKKDTKEDKPEGKTAQTGSPS
ncbi:MAG: twin-arginine translocase TatA/TatE family subunit [Desulfomonilaceae bacterium]